MVTLDELAKAVSDMRKLQKEYFLRRTQRHLSEAKKAEVEVDRLLTLLAPTNVDVRDNGFTQVKLFE